MKPSGPQPNKTNRFNIQKIEYHGVLPNGTFANGSPGAITTTGSFRMSAKQGCGMQGCHCSPGYWLSVVLPRTATGDVNGYHVKFRDRKTMRKFVSELETKGLLNSPTQLYAHLKSVSNDPEKPDAK